MSSCNLQDWDCGCGGWLALTGGVSKFNYAYNKIANGFCHNSVPSTCYYTSTVVNGQQIFFYIFRMTMIGGPWWSSYFLKREISFPQHRIFINLIETGISGQFRRVKRGIFTSSFIWTHQDVFRQKFAAVLQRPKWCHYWGIFSVWHLPIYKSRITEQAERNTSTNLTSSTTLLIEIVVVAKHS